MLLLKKTSKSNFFLKKLNDEKKLLLYFNNMLTSKKNLPIYAFFYFAKEDVDILMETNTYFCGNKQYVDLFQIDDNHMRINGSVIYVFNNSKDTFGNELLTISFDKLKTIVKNDFKYSKTSHMLKYLTKFND